MIKDSLLVTCIVVALNYSFDFKVQGNVIINGTLESAERGNAILFDVYTRDTLAKSKIENHHFELKPDKRLDPNQVLPAMIFCLQEDNRGSYAAPIALEAGTLGITIGKDGYSSYTGSAFQNKFTELINSSKELDGQLFDPETGVVNDSIQSVLGKKYEAFYLNTRNNPYKTFTSLLIYDFIDRKFINPQDLEELSSICNTSPALDTFDQKICKAIGSYGNEWKGQAAPQFSGMLHSGEFINLKDRIGPKILVLDFWASWCGPCIKEMPLLKELYAEGNLEIIGISIDEQKTAWEKSLVKLELPWSNILDQGKQISKLYNVTAVPVKFVIDRKGVIQARNPEDLRGFLKTLE